jgi:hypothetical protein
MFKYFLIRSLTFITVTICWYFSFWWCAIPLSIWYAYQFRAYELVVLGLLIDIEFSVNFDLPLYTLGFLVLFIIMEWIKPRLRNQDTI